MKLKIIIVLVVLFILYIIFRNMPIPLSSENHNISDRININDCNIAKLKYSCNINNKKSVGSTIKQKPIHNMFDQIEDKILIKPDQIKPFELAGNINIDYNIYEPPLNQYDVQSGLYDNNPLPKQQIFKPIGVEVKNRVNLDSNNNIYIHEIYDNILNDRPKTSKEIDEDKYKIIPAYKGYSLGIDNWNYYKNEDYSNGGAYETLHGIENNKKNKQRVIDGYNDFELKEWI